MRSSNKVPKDKPAGLILIEATLTLMGELVKILELEIKLVSDRKFEEHKELLRRKQRLTTDYSANLKSIAAQPDIVQTLPEKIVAALREMAHKLAEVSKRNAEFLSMAIAATQRLIQDIVSIVKRETMPSSVYRNPKTAHLELGNYSPVCKPIAVVRTA